MINFIKHNLTIRRGFVFGVISLIFFNVFFISLYYQFFLSERITDKYQEIYSLLEDEIKNISSKIDSVDNIDTYLSEYIEDKNFSIVLTDIDSDKTTEYSDIDSKFKKRNNVSASKIIKIKDEYYMLTITEKRNIVNFNIALDFLLFEIISFIVLAILGIFMSNAKLLKPITALSKDFNNYKLGIIPKKRKPRSEIDVLQNDFVNLVNDLEEEKSKQNRIIASISHDIKTPLTSILGYSERLLTNDKLSNETKNKYANTIYNKSLSLKEIVEEFDDYLSCNIKDDKKTERIYIKYIVEYLEKYYKDDLKEKGIDFKVKANCPNALIDVDLAKFKRIFSNTITNSIRHFDKDKKILNISINEQKNGKIVFEIADNGSGCKEDLVLIFEPLYTTDKSRKISGLGLSICKEIVESHNGTIRAENNKLGGFSVVFTIPASKED